MDSFPIWVILVATILVVVGAIELGHRLGRVMHRRSADEKESSVSAMSAAILGLLAFMLAFTFDIASDRHDARKVLVRDEANAIGTAYLRADFLPDADRAEAKRLFQTYVDGRLAAAKTESPQQVHAIIEEAVGIQNRLWAMAVANARKDMNSDVAALYIDSLNALFDIHSTRKAVALHARIPSGIWLVLYTLVLLGMLGVGYQTGIAGSRRTWVSPILAFAFSIVVALIAALDNSHSGYITVSQQPLEDAKAAMLSDAAEHPR